MQSSSIQNPFFRPIKRKHKTEEELNAPVSVVKIRIHGEYTCRGEHRKEVIAKHFEAEVEVPIGFDKGHIKLAANRHIKNELKGIRARTCYHDESFKPVPVEHKRRVKDFMSYQGLMDNNSMKREYDKEIAARKAEADAMAEGIAPAFADDSQYGADGLPKFSEKTYVAQ